MEGARFEPGLTHDSVAVQVWLWFPGGGEMVHIWGTRASLGLCPLSTLSAEGQT